MSMFFRHAFLPFLLDCEYCAGEPVEAFDDFLIDFVDMVDREQLSKRPVLLKLIFRVKRLKK